MADSDEENEHEPYEIKFEGAKTKRPYVGRDGNATASFPNGDTFSGAYEGGTRNGKGVYTWAKGETSPATGAKYNGDYKDGQRSGNGSFIYPDGSKYTGQWANNMRHGRGTYVYANGDRYCGQWVKDVKEGPGTYLYAESQTALSGTFDKGRCLNGKWDYHDKDGPFVCRFDTAGKVVEYGGRSMAS